MLCGRPDMVIHSGGFGVIALDLAEASETSLGRIPPTTWFRWRRAIEATTTVLAVVAARPVAKSCSALLMEMTRRKADFQGNLLRAAEYEASPRKPIGKERRFAALRGGLAMFACIHGDDALRLAGGLSPDVEMVDARTAVFTITPRQVASAKKMERIAIAETAEAAILAARHFPGVTILPPGEEGKILGPLPIDALPPDAEIFHILELWGIRSLAQLAALPEDGLVEAGWGRAGLVCRSWRGGRWSVHCGLSRRKFCIRTRWNSIIRWSCRSRFC